MSEFMPAKILRIYSTGRMSLGTAIDALMRCASETEPEEISLALNPFWLGEIRTATLKPPKRAEDVFTIFGGTTIGPPSPQRQAIDRRRRQEWFDGNWAWHRYFADLDRNEIDPSASSQPGAEDDRQ